MIVQNAQNKHTQKMKIFVVDVMESIYISRIWFGPAPVGMPRPLDASDIHK